MGRARKALTSLDAVPVPSVLVTACEERVADEVTPLLAGVHCDSTSCGPRLGRHSAFSESCFAGLGDRAYRAQTALGGGASLLPESRIRLIPAVLYSLQNSLQYVAATNLDISASRQRAVSQGAQVGQLLQFPLTTALLQREYVTGILLVSLRSV